MDLLLAFAIFCLLTLVFVGVQLLAILWLLKENERLGELAERNTPPF